MIIRNRRKRDSLIRRLVRPLKPMLTPPGYQHVLSPESFQNEIDREIHRSNRRSDKPEFAIISLDFCDFQVKHDKLDQLIDAFRVRLRVSDSLGWHQLKLSILLPETDKIGAELVADSLNAIAANEEVSLETSISVYPWDDVLIGNSSGPEMDWQDTDPVNGDSINDMKLSSADDGLAELFDREQGGVAMMAPPKPVAKMKIVPAPTSRGTGNRYLFAAAEATPGWKRAIDIFGAGAGLVVLSPLFLTAAAAIKISSPGPVFFRQQREGKDGKIFNILKFRTMVPDAEAKKAELRELSEQDGPAFKIAEDPRVTKVGKYLRKSCIDELPQLVNVLAGTMSLVGPRPLPIDESQACTRWQRQRLAVLPGLTCIWQARGGRDIKFTEWMRMDMEYIRQRGFFYDLRLIGETAWIVLRHRGSV